MLCWPWPVAFSTLNQTICLWLTALFFTQHADGVEYLLVPVDISTLNDFLEKEDMD